MHWPVYWIACGSLWFRKFSNSHDTVSHTRISTPLFPVYATHPSTYGFMFFLIKTASLALTKRGKNNLVKIQSTNTMSPQLVCSHELFLGSIHSLYLYSWPQSVIVICLDVFPEEEPKDSTFRTTSIPSTTVPNTTCLPSSLKEGRRQLDSENCSKW